MFVDFVLTLDLQRGDYRDEERSARCRGARSDSSRGHPRQSVPADAERSRIMGINANDSSCPDELVPSQWFGRFVPSYLDVPERRLLLAVLSDAVRLLHAGRKQRAEVLAWIRGQPARITFQAVCDELAIDAATAARQLVRTQAPRPITLRRLRAYRQAGERAALGDQSSRPSGVLDHEGGRSDVTRAEAV